ncbi:helix-turn-helix transcriptional regulator [Nakamurella lactea]|uniref:helix-turn-helix transcriptional regulator n=1 Tax=Nakamurella lactea TaxID=459515 RepID=UPI00049006D9|nr:helix-turn-helix transcriptional regulator [Nakamurella lactea]
MRSMTDLAVRPGFSVSSVTCRDDHTGWSSAEMAGGHRVVLIRRGRFRRRAAGCVAELDATVGYLALPGDEEHFSHPAGGDVCTSVNLTREHWAVLAGDEMRLRRRSVYVDAALALAHRRLLAAATTGETGPVLSEQLLGLVGRVLTQAAAGPVTAAAAGQRVSPGDQVVVARARAAVIDGDPAADGLFTLADLLAVSPYRLSRAFSREMGVSLTRYRNRVRVGLALDRLAQGERSLGVLAADLGFADQAHLSRTVREHLGQTPVALRRLLAPDPVVGGSGRSLR